jgi:hypothetical protein
MEINMISDVSVSHDDDDVGLDDKLLGRYQHLGGSILLRKFGT